MSTAPNILHHQASLFRELHEQPLHTESIQARVFMFVCVRCEHRRCILFLSPYPSNSNYLFIVHLRVPIHGALPNLCVCARVCASMGVCSSAD